MCNSVLNKPEESRINMKLLDKFVRSQLELTRPLSDGTPLDSARSFQDRIGKVMHFSRRRDVVVKDKYFDVPTSSLVIPRDELRGGVILHLHGGGYVGGSIEYANGFASVLSAECGIRVISVQYRLAPEHPYPAALEDALAAYRRIIAECVPPEKVVVVGESAGGGLAYALCLKLKELGEPQPAGIIAISPWCDLTLSGDSYEHNKEADPSLTKERLRFFADCYVGAPHVNTEMSVKRAGRIKTARNEELEALKRDPYLSPLFGDLTGTPPSLIFVGGDEILLSDSLSLRDKLVASGSSAQLVCREGMWHDYVLFALKSCRGDFERMNEFLRKVLPCDNERKLKWMKLDNTGKIYPASRTARWNNIFRISFNLNEEIDREVLQSALDVTVRRFPSIAVRIHRGVFWYYLEEIPHAPRVGDEKSYPLVRMPFDDIRHCAFRVIVYKKRVACEFFHAVTDGNGALVFMKTLIAEYLTEKHGVHIPTTHGVLDRLEYPKEEEYTDLYPKHKAPVGKTRRESDAYRIHGTLEPDFFCHVTTFMMRSDELVELAHRYGVTLTALLAAVFVKAAMGLQRLDTPSVKRQKEIKVLLPCDLRRIFGKNTLRNFALYVSPGIDPRLGEYTVEEIAVILSHKMALELTEKNMSAMIYTNVKDEENMLLRIAPLFLKNIVMKLFFLLFGEKKSTLSLSNLGRVTLPPEMESYVERMDFTLGTQSTAPYNAGVISYRGSLNLNVIRNIKEPRLEMALYRILRDECKVHVKVESNER